MKYEEYQGNVQELIAEKLSEIERTERVKILHAVESGSRAWGFASPDSDYDVRFIYVRREADYLRLEQTKDFINWELNETLDINGWDLRKALQQFHKSNVTLYEWSNSPVVYRTTPEWEEVKQAVAGYFSVKSGMYQYYGTAKSNFNEYLQGDLVKYKKYFYVLRPLLACAWISERRTPPPVLFDRLSEEMLPEELKEEVEKLLKIKVQVPESRTGERIEGLNRWMAERLAELKSQIDGMEDDRNGEWNPLNEVFLHFIKSETL